MSTMPWFRFYSETRRDVKLLRIARETGLPFIQVVGAWAIILCIGNESPVRGSLYVTEKIRYCNEDVTNAFVTDDKTSAVLLEWFLKMDLLHLEGDTYCITNWAKRQRKSDDSNQRVRQYRDKQAENTGGCNGKNPLPSTSTSSSLINLNIFRLYEQEVGTVTSTIRDELVDAEKEYPIEWIKAAIEEAAINNKRNWKYILAILKRWKAEGFQSKNHKSKQEEIDPRSLATEVY